MLLFTALTKVLSGCDSLHIQPVSCLLRLYPFSPCFDLSTFVHITSGSILQSFTLFLFKFDFQNNILMS